MKILYAVQATGNGHISRAADVVPILNLFADTEVFLSGENSGLPCPFPVKFRSKGCSLFYNHRGGIDYYKILKNLNVPRIVNEARALPVEKYDIVISDFESITALACKIKNIPFLHFGHQASFSSLQVPRPQKLSKTGEWILKNYAGSDTSLGLHFKPYDSHIYNPILRHEILTAQPVSNGRIVVYLNQFPQALLVNTFQKFKQFHWDIFTSGVVKSYAIDNIILHPIERASFTKSLISCEGIITGAGFETPAEALYLNKKLMVIPIAGQYEQWCNAAALKDWNIQILNHPDEINLNLLNQWLNDKNPIPLEIKKSSEEIIEAALNLALACR